jgi:hypothetical protein
VLFQHAMRYGWATANPIRLVRQSALPAEEEIIITLVEVAALLQELRDPFYSLILLACVTGLRRGELFGLKWEDVGGRRAQAACSSGSRASRDREAHRLAQLPTDPCNSTAVVRSIGQDDAGTFMALVTGYDSRDLRTRLPSF